MKSSFTTKLRSQPFFQNEISRIANVIRDGCTYSTKITRTGRTTVTAKFLHRGIKKKIFEIWTLGIFASESSKIRTQILQHIHHSKPTASLHIQIADWALRYHKIHETVMDLSDKDIQHHIYEAVMAQAHVEVKQLCHEIFDAFKLADAEAIPIRKAWLNLQNAQVFRKALDIAFAQGLSRQEILDMVDVVTVKRVMES